LQLGDMRRAAGHRYFFHPLGQHPGARIRVRRAAGNGENPKAIDLEAIGQRSEQRRPVDEPAIRLEIGVANSGAIRRDDAHADIARGVVRELGHRPRAGPAMTKENRDAAWVAVFAERDRSPVFQFHDISSDIHDREVICTAVRQTEDCVSRERAG
jgi:hypothetical protein